jgi:hypothetical protein
VIRPGAQWGVPASGAAAIDGRGGDEDLAALVAANTGALVRFAPDDRCDLARAIGLTMQSPATWELPIDAIDTRDGVAVNMVVLGARPDRVRWWTRSRTFTVHVDDRLVFEGPATSVVVANGQFLAGLDLVPRGHPGDGRLEVQVYAVRPGERSSMRRRLATGTHVPHPGIASASGRRIRVRTAGSAPGEVDGIERAPSDRWNIEVLPGAVRVLV